ncbi:hypothetical protein ABH17_026925 (plasmid) [Bacillus toyonensis]|uniref:hypothetical protein n=1 Tax=Bacillus toyonensis TaxID=155322 RepID=UPI0006AA31E7|nr:hypothetical protein [Bacillus toyonensis]OKO50955.1 hypothetical protein ABH17_026925 [Bacillus toyonensis]
MNIGNYKKSHIKVEDIKANILSYTVLRIDYKGLLTFDRFIDDFQDYLSEEGFVAEKDFLSVEDIEVIDVQATFYKYVGKEPVVRFIKNNNATRIIVTRYFTYIYLDYRTSHKLERNIKIFNDLVTKIRDKNGKFVRFNEVSLKKNNAVIIGTMQKILECFETRLFNEASFEINRLSKNTKTKLLASKSENMFMWDEMLFKIENKISEGFTSLGMNSRKECYEIVLDIEGSLSFNDLDEQWNSLNEVKPMVQKINSGIFEIFKLHLSEPFLKDMVKGESNKVLKGLNKNEQI